MKTFNRLPILLVFLFTTVYNMSCQRPDEGVAVVHKIISNDSLSVYTNFLKNVAGFSSETIVFNNKQRAFIIDGDMWTSLDDVRRRYAMYLSNKGAKVRQWRHIYTVDQEVVKQVKIYIENGIPNQWVDAVNSAIEYWNNVPNTQLQFKLTTEQSLAQIRITTYNDNPNTFAAADLPISNGTPGFLLRINMDSYSFYSGNATLLRNIITHELGHNVGLRHTDAYYDIASNADYDQSAVFIPGTPQPGQDPNSIMNRVAADTRFITAGDVAAIRAVYPFTFSSWVDRPRADYDESTRVIVTWDNSVISSSATLTISLHDVDDVFVTTLATGVANTGSRTISTSQMISRGIVQDGLYLINIEEVGNPSHKDSSDDPFQYLAN